MTTTVPRSSLTFLAQGGKLACKYGFKKGLAKATAKINPATMVAEAAISVVEAVNSFVVLKQAQAHRDGLRNLIAIEHERLRVEREQLKLELDVLKKELLQNQDVRERLGRLAQQCAHLCFNAFDELQVLRAADIPDVKLFEEQQIRLEDAWQGLRRALCLFYDLT